VVGLALKKLGDIMGVFQEIGIFCSQSITYVNSNGIKILYWYFQFPPSIFQERMKFKAFCIKCFAATAVLLLTLQLVASFDHANIGDSPLKFDKMDTHDKA
jgi:hypothetical protein